MSEEKRPEPVPHSGIGDTGYQAWIHAARWAPEALAKLVDPEAGVEEHLRGKSR